MYTITNQPDTDLNPNSHCTTKIVSIQLNIVTCPTYVSREIDARKCFCIVFTNFRCHCHTAWPSSTIVVSAESQDHFGACRKMPYNTNRNCAYVVLDHIVICWVKSGQTVFQLRQRAWVDSVRHRLGLGHRSAGPMSLLDYAISFYRRHSLAVSETRFSYLSSACCV